MDNFQIKENKLIFENGQCIEFDNPVLDFSVFDDMLIIVLNIKFEIRNNQNVYALSDTGETIWRIENSKEFDIIGNCPYVRVATGNEHLILFNWCGFRCEIDPKNGKILNKIFTK